MSNGCRNRWKKGAFLIIDSESGMTRYSDQVTRDYTGEMVTRRWAEQEQPQDFIKPSDDPKPIPFCNPGLQSFEVDTCLSEFVGNTTITTPFGSANHLYICIDQLITDSGLFLTTDSGTILTVG